MVALDPFRLLLAYQQGIFPMADQAGRIEWYDPDPRAILPLENFHLSRSLQRVVRSGRYTIQVNTAFSQVMEACAAPAPGREETWISPPIITVYCQLQTAGFAHSVECWQDGRLVGGLYGIAINSFFAGESMFSRQDNASKVALVHLVQRLKARGFLLLDVQFTTPHLQQFGVIEIPRRQYHARLAQAIRTPNRFS